MDFSLDSAAPSLDQDQVDTSSMPSFLMGADNHNIGNGNSSWYDPSTWGDKAVGAGKFAAVSLASGMNSFYNTAAAVNNWFGGSMESNDTLEWISSMDDDLGQYYAQNREAADLVGFVATSFLPGLAATKVLNAGQVALKAASAGNIGVNMSRVTGLLAPDVAKYVGMAAQDLARSQASFSIINANTIKALAAGVGQAALESAVFETAVAATMFKSPVLEHQDIGDLVNNIITGTVLGGAIGGALSAAGTVGKIKKAKSLADEMEKPWTHITENTLVDPAERVITRFDDLAAMKNVPFPEVDDGMLQKLNRLSGDKESKLMNLARQDIHEMVVGSDKELGNAVADSLLGADSQTVVNNLFGSKEIARLSAKTSQERTINKLLAKLDIEGTKDLKVGYVKLVGEDAGALTFTPPSVTSLADMHPDAESVMGAVKKYGFKEKKAYDLYATKNHLEAEARYIWADKTAELKLGMTIHENDIPLLEKAFDKNFLDFDMVLENGQKVSLDSTQELFEHLRGTKEKLVTQLQMAKKFTNEEIAKITNTRLAFVEGEHSSDLAADLLARQTAQKEYTQRLIDKGLWDASKGEKDISLLPTHFKISYDTSALAGVDNNVIDAMSYIKTKQKVIQQDVDRVVAKHAGELSGRFWHPDEKVLLKANSQEAGPGLFSFANGNYHSLASWSENIGSSTHDLMGARVKAVTETLDPIVYKLANNQEAAIEFEVIKNKVAATAEKYVLNEERTALIPRKLRDYRAAIAEGADNVMPPKLELGAPEEIAIKSQEARDAIAAHINLNGARNSAYKELRAVQGLQETKDIDTFYPIRPNPKDYPHFAFVVDPSVSGTGHMSMIHASSDRELTALMDKVPDNFKVITKSQSEELHVALGDFNYERTLHENYIDSELKSRGINTPFFSKTDPQAIAKELLDWHQKGEQIFSRELVNAKFEKEFTELRRLGEQYTNVAASKYGGNVSYTENITKNPYMNYVKTALDISQMNEHPLLQGFNTLLDKSFSRMSETLSDAWKSTKSVEDLDKVNQILKQNGVKSGYYDAALNTLVNHSPAQGALRSFVSKANSLISTLVLRLDPLNAINNAVGANVLLGTETKSIIRAIEGGNSQVAGELAQLAKVKVPGTDDLILSPTKLIGNSMKRYFEERTGSGTGLLDLYKKNGWITDITSQYKSMLDDVAIRGTESSGELSRRINAAFTKAKGLADVGEVVSGNRLAEEFNRFVAADVMKQISDLGIKAGVISEAEQLGYINTFVNRTQGNILASQRPLMFQGALGQAIGLFQTYQFNMIQQLLRHVAEGSGKDVATLLGLQGTIYGMNGLPAFNFINQHIVGTASGNPQHKDLYTATYGVAGKEAGDWLMYGIPSNLLHANLYTRGDINPRQVTVIPTNPKDIPMISAAGTFFGNLKDTASKISTGGNVWETLLQGIEHNGLSRPLAGLAQTLQSSTGNGKVYSTDTHGNIMGSNDLASLSTLARLAGGRPFDEAIANDATYRIAAYQAADHAKVDHLNETIKSTMIAGQVPDEEQMSKFAKDYAAIGGKQKNFNRHVMQLYKRANTAQANAIAENLKNPMAQSMQQIMGGNAIQDGRIAVSGAADEE